MSVRRLFSAVAAILPVAFFVAPAGAQALDCTFDATTRVISADYNGKTNLQVLNGSFIAVDTTFCEDPNTSTLATVTNTDTIEVSGGPTGNPIGREFVINLTEGALRPGATPETDGGESDIEVVFLDIASPPIDVLGINDTGVNAGIDDDIAFGVDGINLNADEAVGDVDVTSSAGTIGSYIHVDGQDGDDTITAVGGFGTGAARDFFSFIATGGEGEDNITLPPGFSSLAAPGPGNDTVDGSRPDGSTISYTNAGGGVNVNLAAQPGAQSVGGGEGTDTLIGLDNIYGSPYGDTLGGDAGINSIEGRGGSDTITGGAEGDFLNPGNGDDTVDAGPGDDSIYLSPGNDEIDAGADTDEIQAYAATGGVSIDLAVTGDQNVGGGMDIEDLSGIEDIIGSKYGDTLAGTDGPNKITGGAGGYDTILGRGGDDYFLAPGKFGAEPPGLDIDGGAGDEEIPGTDNADIQRGGPGDDEIRISNGDDVIDGGADTDLLDSPFLSSSTEGASIDLRVTAPQVVGVDFGTDTISGIENVNGTKGPDTLIGDDGPNELDAGSGDAADKLVGNGGDDVIDGSILNDAGVEIDGGPGADEITGSDGPDEIDGGDGPDNIKAWAGDDLIEAFDGAVDEISCGTDDDTVGGDAFDVLSNCETFTEGHLGGGTNDPQCSDGVDNDGDGKIDFPADPGCSSAADNDETDPKTNPGPDTAACDRATAQVAKAKGQVKKAKKVVKKAKKKAKKGSKKKRKSAAKKLKKAKKKLKKKQKALKKAKQTMQEKC